MTLCFYSSFKNTTFVVLLISILFIAHYQVASENRAKRFISIIDWLSTGGRCSGCSKPCLQDFNVINGYCCGCARDSDYLPINCYEVDEHCPHDGRRLCKYYDYMLDCCCP